LFKADTKQFYRYLGAKTIAMKDQPLWKSLWEEKEAEWIRREEIEKEKNK
jgi:hypothetical protein